MLYQFQQWQVDSERFRLEQAGAAIKMRPKTFELLLLFLKQPQKLLTKQELLDGVWNDATVDEQVLFQSIREIRQTFAGIEVIKTHPRKGYSWIEPIQISSNAVVNQKLPQKRNKLITVAMTLIAIAVLASSLLWRNLAADKLSGGIIVLPIKSQLEAKSHGWVRYGAMDQVIQSLNSSASISVFSLDHVLTLTQRAQLPEQRQLQDIQRLLQVSGAAMVVDASISGYEPAFQLSYQLHQANDTKQGVVFGKSIAELTQGLADQIANHTGLQAPNSRHDLDGQFQQQMLYQALQYRQSNNLPMAAQLLTTFVQLQPNKPIGYRLLTDLLARQQQWQQAQDVVQAGLALVKPNDIEHHRLQFYHALVEIQLGESESGISRLRGQLEAATSHFDWLYLGYMYSLLGEAQQLQQDYQQAHDSFSKSLRYQQKIHCPVGTSLAFINLAKNQAAQRQYQQSQKYLAQAEALIAKHQLTDLQTELQQAFLTIEGP